MHFEWALNPVHKASILNHKGRWLVQDVIDALQRSSDVFKIANLTVELSPGTISCFRDHSWCNDILSDENQANYVSPPSSSCAELYALKV